MKTMAQINSDNVVTNIIVADNDWAFSGFVEYTEINPAIIGGSYINGKFIPPQPFSSWTLNANAQWEAPVAMPIDGKMYSWDEATTSWREA